MVETHTETQCWSQLSGVETGYEVNRNPNIRVTLDTGLTALETPHQNESDLCFLGAAVVLCLAKRTCSYLFARWKHEV